MTRNEKFVFVLLLVGLTTFLVTHYYVSNEEGLGDSRIEETTVLEIGTALVQVGIADERSEQVQGLSGREELNRGTGLLFVYSESDTYGIWMPDMHFAIDIVWFDENWNVVSIQENATPESYPEVFKPSAPARYILEVPAGFTAEHDIKSGMQARVDLDT